MPKISVVMTVFNGLPHLPEAVGSILDQTEKDFQFIIVDNASTDGSKEYLSTLTDPRVTIIENPVNVGQTRALNIGIAQASSEYIARMDADDVALSQRLAIQLEFMSSHPKAGVVGGWHEEIDASGRRKKIMRYPLDPLEIKFNLLSDGNLSKRCLAHPTVFFRTKALKDVGGYDETFKYAQDYRLWTMLVKKWEIHNVPKIVLRYRTTMDSTSNRYRPEMEMELDKIVSENVGNNPMLTEMLRNRLPPDMTSPANLFKSFDSMVNQYSAQLDGDYSARYRERIKGYFLPRLARRWPGFSFRFFLSLMLSNPSILWDAKFFKNIAKLFLK